MTAKKTILPKFRKKRPDELDNNEQILAEIVSLYGNLVFDLADAVLWSQKNAQHACRTVFRKIEKKLAEYPNDPMSRAWFLKTVCEVLKTHSDRFSPKLSASEQIMLDANLDSEGRLRQFDSYFHRLTYWEQVLFLLIDKNHLAYWEVAYIFDKPEGSLKIMRQQSLRKLEEWVWGTE
jgi:DNA-directed RNA polymerase specialized sigma24 family protein